MKVGVEEGRVAIIKPTLVVIIACWGRDPANGYNLVVGSRISYIF